MRQCLAHHHRRSEHGRSPLQNPSHQADELLKFRCGYFGGAGRIGQRGRIIQKRQTDSQSARIAPHDAVTQVGEFNIEAVG